MKKFLIFIAVLGFLGLFAYFIGIELYVYSLAKIDGSVYYCQQYYRHYPNGYFREQVELIEQDALFQKIKKQRYIPEALKFLDRFPDSKYVDDIVKIKNEVWDEKMLKYEELVQEHKGNEVAVTFFKSVLNYMRDNNKNTIYVRFTPTIDLQDFDDYSEPIKSFLEKSVAIEKKPISDNIADLKNRFRAENERHSVFLKGLNEIEYYTDKLINIESIATTTETLSSDDVVMTIDYKISNSYMDYADLAIPRIWIYSSEEGDFMSYLLGISIDFTMTIYYPRSDKSYVFIGSENPAEHFKNVKSVGDAYARMTRDIFDKYSKDILRDFGMIKQ